MIEFMYQTELWGWWLLVPVSLVALLIFCFLFWHWSKLSILSGFSLAFVALVLILLSISWRSSYQVGCSWHTLQASGDRHKHFLTLLSRNGGIIFSFDVHHYMKHSVSMYDQPPQIGVIKYSATVDRPFQYPFGDFGPARDRTLLRSAFLESLGFQLCWWSIPDTPGRLELVGHYSITMPHWFVLLLSLIFPAFSLRRFLRRRARVRKGLCAKCGYDLRPSNSEKCPECGTPVPQRKEIAKVPDAAKPAA